MSSQTSLGYSADVRLFLIVNGRTIKLGQLGPDFIVLSDPQELPAGEAEITMSVDGRESRWPVLLIHGANPNTPLTRIAPAQTPF